MSDGPDFEQFEDFYRDADTQKYLGQIRRCLRCDEWQAMVILLLTQHAQVDISVHPPPPPEDDKPWLM